MVLAVQRAAALDIREPHLPRAVGEHDDMGAELGGGIDRILARRDGIDPSIERIFRPRPDLDARLLVELAVSFNKAGAQRLHDHRRRLVEALARLVHAEPEGGELAPRKPTPETETKAAFAQQVEHRRLFGDAQRVVPRQDHGCGPHIDVRTQCRQIGHQLQIVGHERIVVEVMLGRPQAVEPEIGGEPREANLLVPDARVGAVVPAIAGEHHHHADIHGPPPAGSSAGECFTRPRP